MRHEEILGLLPHLKYGIDYSPGLWLFLLELLFWVVVAGLSWALVRYKPALLERIEYFLRDISQHTQIWLFAFPVLAILVRVALLPWVPVPVPVVHDEFSYLLASDTFAHGRVTNPPHPMWIHFETFHVNMLPTYQSMYPPAHGLALAIGQKLTGVPWAGVVLSTALMCAAIYWMLLGWLPASWSWLGGAFAVARYAIFSYWVNTYFGGSVAALGGALVLGCLPRFRRETRILTGMIFALGLLVLATSRPLEGLCFSAAIVVSALVCWIKRSKQTQRSLTLRLVPGFLLLVAGFAGILYYNWRGTGNPLVMPYVLNYKTYHVSKPFLFPQFKKPYLVAKLNPIPNYDHQAMRSFYVRHELPDVWRVKLEGIGYFLRVKCTVFYAFFLWPLLLLIAPGVFAMIRDKDFRIVPIAVALMAADLFLQIWPPEAHYAAPAAGAIILIALYSLRHFRVSDTACGPWASRAITLTMALWLLSPILERIRDPFLIPAVTKIEKADTEWGQIHRPLPWMPLEIQRARIESDLQNRPGKHLVIVHHPYHDVPWLDLIYNDADIDGSKVVWARDMGYVKNKELIDYYSDRQVWYLDRGDMMASLRPYDVAITPWRLALDAPAFEGTHARDIQNASAATDSKSLNHSAHLVGVSQNHNSWK